MPILILFTYMSFDYWFSYFLIAVNGLVYVALPAFAGNEHHTRCVCPEWAPVTVKGSDCP